MSDNEDYDSSSSEELTLLRKAVAVDLPDDFDPNIVPQNGLEYLQTVMYEAKRCKNIVTVNIDSKKIKNTSLKVDVIESSDKAPASMLPTKEWQDKKLKDFSDLRTYLERKTMENPLVRHANDHLQIMVTTTLPTFEMVNNFAQETKMSALQEIMEQMDALKAGETIDYRTGVWIYAILATIGIPLSPHACHCLRDLARKCSKIRSRLISNAKEEDYISLNLFICIVARYFRQLDLAD